MRIDRVKIKRQMKAAGINQFADVADAVGVTRQSLSRWFAGDQFSSVSLAALCATLSCTPNDVLVWEHPVRSPGKATDPLNAENQRGLAELAATGQDVNEMIAAFLRNEQRRAALLAQAAGRGKAS